MTILITPLIICGGSGTRLWPASRGSRPKQFLPLLGTLSTFQETVQRVSDPILFASPVIVTNRDHRFLVADQLKELGVDADVVLEPEGRDSGPAILAGTQFIAEKRGADPAVLVLAADHMVRDIVGFCSACRSALVAAMAGHIVTFGVVPDHAATGYGYIEPGEALGQTAYAVRRFVEKPDAETAARYVRDGYFWNSGNFLFQASTVIDEYRKREPETVVAVSDAVSQAVVDLGFCYLASDAFSRATRRSFDYAVMEKTTRAAVVPASFDWSDVGSWSAVRDLSPQDAAGNAARGDTVFINAHGNVVATDGPLVALVGLDDLAVIVSGDAVLVAKREDTAGIKALVERLKISHQPLTQKHIQSFRGLAQYRSLERGAASSDQDNDRKTQPITLET
jgi:mannose-1-phosphate guanylyltransferase/mannose-6-phosphate isomerase